MTEEKPQRQRQCRDTREPVVVITVPTGGPPYLPGARLLAVLAQPPLRDGDIGWKRIERALGRLCIEAAQFHDPQGAELPRTTILSHAMLALTEANRTDKQTRKVLDARMAAAHVVIGLIRRSGMLTGAAPYTHRGRPTIDPEIQRTIDAEADREDWPRAQGQVVRPRFDRTTDNFDNRVLRPSLPVIHLAMAAAMAIDRSQRLGARLPPEQAANLPRDIGGRQISIADILVCPELSRGIITEAQAFELLVAQPPLPQPRRGVPRVSLQLE
jgi:hypothetical protein